MVDNQPELVNAIQQARRETGARMVVLGEEHNVINSIQSLRDSLPALKASGTNSLYVELPEDWQPIVDKALQGDQSAQRDLRLKYERCWGFYGGTEGAQQRYDLLFDANKAGLRVKCVDMDSTTDHMQRFNSLGDDEKNGALSARIGISNPVIVNNINRIDDGKPAILLIGLAHTYRPSDDPHIEAVDDQPIKYFKSALSGVDQQLDDKGIKTVSIDFHQHDSLSGLEKNAAGGGSDYTLPIPKEITLDDPPYHTSTGNRVYWDRLSAVYDSASVQAEVAGDRNGAKLYTAASQSIGALPRLLDDPTFLKLPPEAQSQKLGEEIKKVEKAISPLEMLINDDVLANAALSIHEKWLPDSSRKDFQDKIKTIIDDNNDLHLSGAAQMWQKPGAPLADAATGLTAEWQKAQLAQTPLRPPSSEIAAENMPQNNFSALQR